MNRFQCSCGFAADDAESLGDHLGSVFDRADDIGTDGKPHAELSHASGPGCLCACGFTTADMADLNDHLLTVLIPPDGIGIDGNRHVPVDMAAPLDLHDR